MTLHPPNEKEQLSAINYSLKTAPKVQKQLKEKFGYGENMFFDLDLIEYRIHNSHKVIAQDLDVASLYGVSEGVAEKSASYAFIGYDSEEFLPEYKFEGLFGEQLSDIIEESRRRINGKICGRKTYAKGLGKRTAKERSEHSRKGYAKSLGKRTAKERSEHSRKAAEARGDHIWSLDKLVSLHEIREESIGEGRYKTKPCWTYVTEEFNERHGTELTKGALRIAYLDNKHRLSEEE